MTTPKAEPQHPPVDNGLIDFAERLADAAREIALLHFRTDLAIEDKADSSPVTLADKGAEQAMRALIGERYPDHGILGEEFGHHGADRDWTWVLDPIDGTGAFIVGMPLFGVLIALAYRGQPVLGLIDAPALGERWIGAAGRPSLFNGAPCRVSGCDELSGATMHTTSPEMFTGRQQPRYDALCAATKRRRFGGDCYQYGILANGGIDLVLEDLMKPHDFMALAPVVTGAGGLISDWSGAPLTIESGGEILASSTPALHEAAIETLRAASRPV